MSSRFCSTVIASLILLVGCFPSGASPQSSDDEGFGPLRRLSTGTKSALSASRASEIGFDLAQHSFPVMAMRPTVIPDAQLRQLGDFLADAELAWRDGRKQTIHENKLVEALNRHLELEHSPEYLQIRPFEMRRIRMEVWMRVPELTTGVSRKEAEKGKPVLDSKMSPFEAYLASDLLLYQKTFNDAYVRTTAENRAKRDRVEPLKPGLHVLPENPRRQEFEAHVRALAREKWQSAGALIQLVSAIFDESGQ